MTDPAYLATITDLQAANTSTLPASTCIIQAYGSSNAFGGGTFSVVSSGTPDGGMIIQDTSGRLWQRQWSGQAISVRWYGARGDGSTDDTSAIQSAINAAISFKTKLEFGVGEFLVNGGLTVSAALKIEGVGWSEFTGYYGQYNPQPVGTQGTIISTTSTSTSVFTFQNTANHAEISGVMFKQAQPSEGSGWSPTAYPPTIQLAGGAVYIHDVFFWFCYHAIQIGGVGIATGRATIKHVWGSPIWRGITIQFAADTVCIDDIHFYSAYSPGSPNIEAWILNNGTSLATVRNDNPLISNYFAFGYYAGIAFLESSDGLTNKFHISNIDIDGCHYGFLFNTSAGQMLTGQVTNFTYQAPVPETVNGLAMVTASADGTAIIQCANFRSTYSGGSCIAIGGSSFMLGIVNASFEDWGRNSGSTPAIIANTGCTITLGGMLNFYNPNGYPTVGGGGTINQSHAN